MLRIVVVLQVVILLLFAFRADAADTSLHDAIVASPESVGALVTAALESGADPVEVVSTAIGASMAGAGITVAAAVSIAPELEADIVAAAIEAGADPTIVTAASAAGKSPPSPFTPAVLPNTGIGRGGVTPFGVGIVMGGSVASPS